MSTRGAGRRTTAVALGFAALLGGVAGCGDGRADAGSVGGDGTTAPSFAPPSSAAGLCDAVTGRLLRTATGADVAATAADDPGYTCTTDPVARRMEISWRLTPAADSLDEVAEQLRLDLGARRIELPGAVPAWLLSGPWMDRRMVRLVTISGGHTVMVDATSSRLDDRAAGSGALGRAARAVASAYLD